VLKLDFAKAFDTVNWNALDNILEARGFNGLWRQWMRNLLESSKSAVILNGVPSPWINCKRGLRQGDPLSPYLFLLVADTLQALIKSKPGLIRHPIAPSLGCVTLQYADDTLIVMRGEPQDVIHLKETLQMFSNATGLNINYHKSTIVPLNLSSSALQTCVQQLQCRVDSFSQNYLGLPLSATKLPVAAFNPYIARTDAFLSSWQASLLNKMGLVVMINSVLDSQLVYAMSALSVPSTTIAEIDRRRRAFLWAGEANTSSAKCLVAWEKCCTTKDLGGLGIKDFATQNICLLLKLIHRLHCSQNSAWGTWVRENSSLATLQGDLQGAHWETLRSILPLYQAITTVQIKDGAATSFWNDVWYLDEALADKLPALYSHCTKKDASVRDMILSQLSEAFVPRLTPQASVQLQQLQQIVAQTSLESGNDIRKSLFDCGNGRLDSSSIYKLLKAKQNPADPMSDFIWGNCSPPRVQFFMWLASKGRLQCRANLFKKRIVPTQSCEACQGLEETTDHILLHCPFARGFWNALGLSIADGLSVHQLQSLPRIQNVPVKQFSSFIALCCWELWKRRNALIFRNESLTLRQVLHACAMDAEAWRPRFKKKEKDINTAWCTFLHSISNQFT